MSDPINWHDLEILHAVLEQGNFSQAARALGLSQPTVSRHIESLEQKLGRELFTRNGSGMEPSDLALDLAGHTERMNDGMFAILRTLAGTEEVPRGLVTLSIPHGLGGIPLTKALEGFHLQYPDISIDLKLGPQQSNLGRREADIDLRWQQPTEPEALTRCVGSLHMGLYGSDTYLQRNGTPRKAADLNDHYFPYGDEPVMERVLQSLNEFGATPHRFPFHCSGNLLLSHQIGILGLTMTMMPIGLQAPNLQRVLPEYHWEAPDMWLTMHAALRRNRPIRAVWDWLAVHLPLVFTSTQQTPP